MTDELTRLRAENARLREKNTRLRSRRVGVWSQIAAAIRQGSEEGRVWADQYPSKNAPMTSEEWAGLMVFLGVLLGLYVAGVF